jgi:hypothetical protein
MVEVNSHVPADQARTVSNHRGGVWDGTDAFGMSVGAAEKLGHSKGYCLVYCESRGVNCFFVRADLLGLVVDTTSNATRNPSPCVALGFQFSAPWLHRQSNYFGRRVIRYPRDPNGRTWYDVKK